MFYIFQKRFHKYISQMDMEDEVSTLINLVFDYRHLHVRSIQIIMLKEMNILSSLN